MVNARDGSEQLQSEREVDKQIQKIEATNPRKTDKGMSTLQSRTQDDKPFALTYAYVSQTGYYPEDLQKLNQDKVTVISPFTLGASKPPASTHFFGVFDGHGKFGTECAVYVQQHLPKNFSHTEAFKAGDFETAFAESYVQTNNDIHMQEKLGHFSDMMSGTTCISAFLYGRTLYVANVGDSRAIMGVRDPDTLALRAEALSIDQTPFREDERQRVRRCGARVLTMDQIEGYRDINEQNFGSEEDDDGDPPRLWCQDGAYPGTAFTRSIGDQVAERIGVFAEPELLRRELAKEDEFLLIASDGVFEFLSSQAVVDIVVQYDDALEACHALVSEAYRLWLQYEVRTDDISVILVRFKDLQPAPKGPRLERTKSSIKQETIRAGEVRPVRRNLSRVKASAVGNKHIDMSELEGYELPVHQKSQDECARIKAAVRANFLFRHLNDEQLDRATLAMETLEVKAGDVIIKQFDEGDRFYIADFGEYDVEVAVPKTTPNPDPNLPPIPIEGEYEPPKRVFSYDSRQGSNPCFGELALMYSKPRAATVKAKTDGRLWALERNAFRTILMKTPARRLVQLLRKVEVLKPLSRLDLQRMADLMTEEKFADGQAIVKQGENGQTFYIISQGQAIVTKSERPDLPAVKVMDLSEYMYFGERALLHDAPRAANVIAVGPVKVLSINRHDFEEVLGHIEDRLDRDRTLREERSRRNLLVGGPGDVSKDRAFFKGKVNSPGDLDGGVFANGAFAVGSATLRSCVHHGVRITLKALSKRQLVQRKEEALALNEIKVLREITTKSTLIPTLVAAFQTPKGAFQVLNANIVSDFSRFVGKPMPATTIQFVLKSVGSALEFLHGLGWLYRGLVPEAIGLDETGGVQLLDFRFAKALVDDQRTFTICGTPEYMSPEQVANIGHSFEADCWSAGILTYEALTGSTPWSSEKGSNEISVYSSISSYDDTKLLRFAPGTDEAAIDFVKAMLQPDPDQRLATAREVMGHSFLKKYQLGPSPFKEQSAELAQAVASGPKVDVNTLIEDDAVEDSSSFAQWAL